VQPAKKNSIIEAVTRHKPSLSIIGRQENGRSVSPLEHADQ